MTISSTNPHPFVHLGKEQQSAILEQLKGMKGFNDYLKSALLHMGGKDTTTPTPQTLAVMNALDEKAAETLGWKDSVTPRRKEARTINDITWYLALAQKGSIVGSGSALVVGLLHRSNRLFVVASLCVACAFVALKVIASSWKRAFHEMGLKLGQLSWRNQNEFPEKVAAIYGELAKTNYLTRVYLNRSEPDRIELLRLQLFAFKSLRSVMLRLMGVPLTSTPCTEHDKPFFEKFAKINRQGLKASGGVALFAAGLTYYAGLQRAYLMACIGVVQTVGALAISRELFVLQKYSKKIGEASDKTYTDAYKELIQRSWFIRRLGVEPTTMRAEVVEPLDAILKLIPGWKSDAEK